MNKKVLLFLTAILLSVALLPSCMSYKTIPLKGTYSDGNFEEYSDKNFNAVWDNVIDFFAKRGLPIKIIDRSSGLIISGEATMPYTRENSKGELIDKTAWVVVHRIIDPANKKTVPYQSVTAEWNVRIKEVSGKTLVNVNMVNPYYTAVGDDRRTMFKKGSFQSTGVFEKMIYDIVK